MQIREDNGRLTLEAGKYSLVFPTDRPFVHVFDQTGEKLLELFVLSGIQPLVGRDDTVKMGSWTVTSSTDRVVISLEAQSSVWDSKRYSFICTPEGFSYEMEVRGSGQLTEVNYFGGNYSGNTRWGSGFFWSGQNMVQGFNPEPNSGEINYFPPIAGSVIDLMGVPLPGKDDWFFTPPPFCFALQSTTGWLGLGVEARQGANRFTEYSYHGQSQRGFYLSLAYEGHTTVVDSYTLPAIGFYFVEDEYAALAKHVESLSEKGYVQLYKNAAKPDWWFTPIYCGWGSQCYLASQASVPAPAMARQENYEKFMQILTENDVTPGIVVIDDKWQEAYGENCADSAKWQDIKGFIAKQHAEGKKVLLWLKAWDKEGLPDDECIANAAGYPIAFDPTNPVFVARFRASVRRMLSADGYDADGFKIDFSARIPSGPGIKLAGDAWGLELMKKYLYILYDEAKKTKADALVMSHTPHPYLADVLDMIRLNDINTGKDVNKAMTHRARIARIACPDAVIDTDNWPITDKQTWQEYLKLQPELGVPSLYYASHIDSTREALTCEDYELIRTVWQQHADGRN